MAKYSQEGHLFRIETPLGQDVLLLEGFSGQEGVSRPFHFSLQLRSTEDTIDPQDLLREAVTVLVRLPDGSHRQIHGRVSRFIQKGSSPELTEYEAEIVPWFWFLSLSTDCRIFQAKTVLEIIEEVFEAHSDADYEIRCLESYPSREYCVQYRETDLDFVSRLIEEEGIHYFFEHSDGGHKMILADSRDTVPDSRQATAQVATDPQGWIGSDVITDFQREHAVHTTAVTLTDYDYLQPSLDLQSTASTDSREEIYDYPGSYAKVPEGERYADLLLKERSSRQEVATGSGTCRGFESGHQFELTGYYRKDANQSYLLLSVSHLAWGGGYVSGEGEADYSNSFECIPMSVNFRPPRLSPKPVVQGSQTAVVVGPKGEEIFTDEHGRVKVQFPWDRKGKDDENSSCWVRVSHPWAGKGWGAVAIPRIGQEVIVDFLEGDPDRPIVTGRVYNAEQIPPYSLPANKTQTGIKSRSTMGGDTSTFNEIRMEDKKGNELLYVHAERNQQLIVEANRSEQVGHDETITIGNDQSITVGNDRKEEVGANHTETIGSNMTLTVGGSRDMAVGKALTETVGAASSVSIGENHTVTVGKNETLDVGGSQSSAVGGTRSVTVGKNSVHEAKKILLEATDQITLKTGSASITMKKNGEIFIKGGKITIKASKDVIIKGKKIAQN